jgi:all-trans-retinol 13,14-reductase
MTRAWGPTAPRGPYDVLVIGAGLGGLCAASMLAQLGRRVLVLEQHTVPGGFTQSFRRGKWSWDVGLHIVGEMGKGSIAGAMLRLLSGGRLEWTRVPDPYDVIELPDGRTYGVANSLSAQQRNLAEMFPHERDNIARYFSRMQKAAGAMRDYHVARTLMPSQHVRPGSDAHALALATTRSVLDANFKEPALKAILASHWSAYGALPERSAFGIHALVHRHYRRGTFYPVGGSMSIPIALAQTIAEHGGWVQTQASVDEIVVHDGRARGVRVNGGALHAPYVISAAGAHNTQRMLPEAERTAQIEQLPPSCAHVCLYVGFDADIRPAGPTGSNHLVMNRLEESLWDCEGEPPFVYLSFPALKDGGAHTAQVVVMAGYAPFAPFVQSRWRHRPHGYEQLKDRLTQTLTRALLERFPRLEPLIAWRELSTPLSTVHFARGEQGAAYGLEATPERFETPALKVRSPTRGLHLAGCDVALVGITGALAGGVAAAVSVAPEQAGAWLRRVRRAAP